MSTLGIEKYPRRREQMFELYCRGKTTGQIARRYSVGRGYVANVIREERAKAEARQAVAAWFEAAREARV